MAFKDFLNNSINSTSSLLTGKTLEDYANGVVDTSFNIPHPSSADVDLLFNNASRTYAGVDCTVVVIYNENLIVLGNVETFSYSTYREKNPVRTLGRVYAKMYTAGTRTVAGTMVFIQFDENPLYPLFKFFNERADNTHRYSSPLPDDIPPVDVMLIFNNEYGASSMMKLYGVEFFQEGGVFSINDLYSENTMQWVAKDIDPMISAGEAETFKRLLFTKMTQGKTIDPFFASLLSYRQKIANRIGLLTVEIEQHYQNGRGSVRIREKEPGSNTTRTADRRRTRQKERDLARSKSALLETLKKELANVDAQISSYERNNMTTDLQSGIENFNTGNK